ncbi:MAG: hypothetical protein K6E50_12370 [Lachnospiraceae bacterium]|nr:hypothetical protein [Lachnospiraceae bacterium]
MRNGDFRKFVAHVVFWGALCFLFTVVFCLLVDPYNVFHVHNIRDNGIEPNKNYIKMSFLMEEPERFDAFMLGNSRVGSIHTEKLKGVKCYNLTYSAGMVWEHVDNVKTLLAGGAKIKKLYLGVDSASYGAESSGREQDPIRMSYEYISAHPLAFLRSQMNTARAFKSLNTSRQHQPAENYAEIFYRYGWAMDYDLQGMPDEVGRWGDVSVFTCPEYREQMDRTLSSIAELRDICNENGIELVVFTHPMLWNAYKASMEELEYAEFLRRLAQVTPYYNFSGINAVTVRFDNYVDPSHYRAQIGDKLLDCFNDGAVEEELYAEGFGWYVTEENVEELLDLLDRTEEAYGDI